MVKEMPEAILQLGDPSVSLYKLMHNRGSL